MCVGVYVQYIIFVIVRVIKSRRMRWAGHVARMGEERGCIGSWWGDRRERDHWGDLGVDGWIIDCITRGQMICTPHPILCG